MHTDMFSAGHSRADVRVALSQHYARDTRHIRTYDVVTLIALIVAVRTLDLLTACGIVVAAVCATSAMRHFVDNSNRNFYLHRLDWEDAQRGER